MFKVEICGVNTATLPKVSHAEMQDLLKEAQAGNEQARDKLVMANLRLVLSVVQKFAYRSENPDDLFQIGVIGLIKAIKNFDMNLNLRFSTYAVPMVMGEIRRFLRDNSALRVSRSLRDTAYKALKIKEEISKLEHRDPKVDEIAKILNLKTREVAFAIDAIAEPVSLFQPVYNDGTESVRVMDQIGDYKNKEEVWLEDFALRDAIRKLSEKEKQIVSLRYYLGKTQIEVSDEVGISQAQVSRLEKSAIDRLRREF